MFRDADRCYTAIATRDARFDGVFVTGVISTRIYCRPSCPARTPAADRVRFYPTAAAALRDGFRACKRCLPDATPGSPAWNTRADAAARAVRLIHDGVVDRDGVAGLARELGYSPRHLERLLLDEVGATPIDLARTRRAHTARLLIVHTAMPFADVAFAAGFASLRSFNDVIRTVYDATPTELRTRRGPTPDATATGYTSVPLRLPFRPPLFAPQLFGHLAATAVPGVEEWADGRYRRSLLLPHGPGVLEARPPAGDATVVECTVHLTDLRDLTTALHRLRWMLDLDADPTGIDAHLATCSTLRPLVEATPGRRVPRVADPTEFALRAVLGQHVSTAAARTLTARIVAVHGVPLPTPLGSVTRLFPSPAAFLDVDPDSLAMPRTRRAALLTMASALANGTVHVTVGSDWAATRAALLTLPGIGPWTADTIALRALGDPDVFLPTDLGVKLAAGSLDLPTTPGALTRAAEEWRPWRSYAVQHLWGVGTHPINSLPTETA